MVDSYFGIKSLDFSYGIKHGYFTEDSEKDSEV